MANQTNVTSFQYSDGVRFDIDTGAGYEDVGVMEDGVTLTFPYAINEVEWGNAENPDPVAKNMQVQVQPGNLASWNSSILEKISAGVVTRTAVAGTPVAGATQVFSSGGFALNTAYVLDGQNATGLVQTINSVTGSVDGALVLGTGYEMVQIPGGWAITFLTGVTPAQNITVDYDYTPAATYELTAGTTSKVLEPYKVRFRHYTDAAFTLYDWECEIFRVTPDSNGINLTKSGAKSDNTGFDMWTVGLTGNIDTSLTDGEQLYKITMTT